MEIISTKNAPKSIGPFSQAIVSGDHIYCSGQIALNPETMEMTGKDVAEQTQQIFTNIQAVLNSSGLELTNIIKTTVFLKDMADFKEMNSVYEKMFGNHKPARTTIEVSQLPLNALIEIECIASTN
jgi:2-iminobutanoate/2-iminopropanoate deaminase